MPGEVPISMSEQVRQQRKDHRALHSMVLSLQADVATLQSQFAELRDGRTPMAPEPEYGHALQWDEHGVAYGEHGTPFAQVEPDSDGGYRLHQSGHGGFTLHPSRSVAMAEAQRRYGAGFLT